MRTLVLSMPPWPHATRTRKAALEYARSGTTHFLSLQGVGRTSKRAPAGRSTQAGVEVCHVEVRPPDPAPTKTSMARNLLNSYLPGLARLAVASLRTPADVVHVTGAPLIPVALAHRLRFRSRLVLDINERPASVASQGSLFSAFSKVEPRLLRLGARRATVTTVVTSGHAELLHQAYEWPSEILIVRNAPTRDWRADWIPPPPRPLRVVTVGTLFERRGYELIIDAVHRLRSAGIEVHVDIYGSGRSDYVTELHERITLQDLQGLVCLHGPVSSDDVSSIYLMGHLGLAFYESSDPGNDSLSNKIIECVASGRPVLAGDLPENRRFINSTKAGWLTALTVEAIAGRLQSIAEEDLDEWAEHCHEVSTNLAWEREFAPVLTRLTNDVASNRLNREM